MTSIRPGRNPVPCTKRQTTISLSNDLMDNIKAYSHEHRITVSQLVEDALQLVYFSDTATPKQRYAVSSFLSRFFG